MVGKKPDLYIFIGIIDFEFIEKDEKKLICMQKGRKKKTVYIRTTMHNLFSRVSRCSKQRARRNNSIVQIIDRVIIPDNCTAL